MKRSFIYLLFVSTFPLLFSQIGINTELPQATLHIRAKTTGNSSAEGVILPGLTREQLVSKDAVYTVNQKGTIVYIIDLSGTLTAKTANVTSIGYYYFDGSEWEPFIAGPWDKIGTTLPSVSNTDNVYISGNAVVGGNIMATINGGENAALTVLGADASINGLTVGMGKFQNVSNTAVGNGALASSILSDFGMYSNSAFGYQTLGANTTGFFNTALGANALAANDSGSGSVAIGYAALQNNKGITSGTNVAVGIQSLMNNTTGGNNTAVGANSLMSNITGSGNVAIGNNANNIVIIPGTGQPYENFTGNNTNSIAIGNFAYALGDYSIAIGGGETPYALGADDNAAAYAFGVNSIAIGHSTRATADNTIVLGNSSITAINAQVGITTTSDGRVKKDVQANVPGLNFINKLRPVTYHLDLRVQSEITGTRYDVEADKGSAKKKHTGFIAQEVEEAAKEVGYDFSGISIPKNDKDIYGLKYETFVVPLVKAVQEQQKQIELQNRKIEQLEKMIEELKK